MDADRRAELIDVYRSGLLGNTLPFWIQHGVDHEHGGFITSLDREGNVIDTDKSVWQQGRFTWLLGKLHNHVEPREQWLGLAESGARFLQRFCVDPDDGRMWFHVTREGQPIRKRRYAFSESFAAIAMGQLARATGDPLYEKLALQFFQRFLDHNQNPGHGNAKFTDTRPTRSIGFPMIAINTAQELRESIHLSNADAIIDEHIEMILRYHVKESIECVMETVAPNGEIIDHFDGRTLNPGHAIECSWFFMEEGRIRGKQEWIDHGCRMFHWMWQRGWDPDHGGLLYFVDVHGLPISEYWHDMKFWWPQNETIIASLLAYELTGDDEFAACHRQAHDWAHQRFPDERFGEWFGYLHRDGRISTTLKGNLWKGPFHLPRMQLMCWKILERMADR